VSSSWASELGVAPQRDGRLRGGEFGEQILVSLILTPGMTYERYVDTFVAAGLTPG